MGDCMCECLSLKDGFPKGVERTDDELRAFYNRQTDRVRQFVAKSPSQSRLEVSAMLVPATCGLDSDRF